MIRFIVVWFATSLVLGSLVGRWLSTRGGGNPTTRDTPIPAPASPTTS